MIETLSLQAIIIFGICIFVSFLVVAALVLFRLRKLVLCIKDLVLNEPKISDELKDWHESLDAFIRDEAYHTSGDLERIANMLQTALTNLAVLQVKAGVYGDDAPTPKGKRSYKKRTKSIEHKKEE
jgi:hypothetical protein